MPRGLKKGYTNNPNGRPKGVPNKVTSNFRQAINELIDENWATIKKDLKSLEPKDRLMFMAKIFDYTIPKLQSTTIEATLENSKRLEEMNELQLNRLIDQLLEQDHNGANKKETT